MSKFPSPCISVCKFKRDGHCIGCSMSKPQKAIFKRLKSDAQRKAFVKMLVAQQTVLGKYTHWTQRYAKKLQKRGHKMSVLKEM